MRLLSLSLLAAVVLCSCKKNQKAEARAQLVFKFKFDSTQLRLDNIGQPSNIAAGGAAQSPVFNAMSAHYLELAPTAFTALGSGLVLWRAPEVASATGPAIDFDQSNVVGDGGTFFSTPLRNIPPGEYEWLRLSVAYQNFDVKYSIDTTIAGNRIQQEASGTIAGFIGFNNFIRSFRVKERSIAVNGARPQGFWGFESALRYNGITFTVLDSATAPSGATTVVNPLFTSSPVPAGSCVVTGSFLPGKLRITGAETENIVVEVSLSTNKSFEWDDRMPNGRWEPLKGEKVRDMGLRGMLPRIME
ncbi:hypothetical protein [Flaviaesturariibacter amylovorans]|uniref:Fimbrillin family protein n=1 Tax=Flaviaesturariibacter amylovorans TaxID=1084520 RepID=A0ABP8GBI8_9BACT